MKALLSGALLAVAACQPAVAQNMACGPADQVEAFLGEEFGEEMAAYGLTASQRVLEFWVSDTTGTWSLVMRQGDRRCLIEKGTSGQAVAIGEVF